MPPSKKLIKSSIFLSFPVQRKILSVKAMGKAHSQYSSERRRCLKVGNKLSAHFFHTRDFGQVALLTWMNLSQQINFSKKLFLVPIDKDLDLKNE